MHVELSDLAFYQMEKRFAASGLLELFYRMNKKVISILAEKFIILIMEKKMPITQWV